MTSTSNNNLLTVSEMERKELRPLIVFLERVPCLFSSLFAEILILSLYYSLRALLLHLFCVNRRHRLLRAFLYVFLLSSLCSDLGLLSVWPQSWNCICCTKLCAWIGGRGRLSPFWTLPVPCYVKVMVIALHCDPPATEVFGMSCVSIAETVVLCSFVVVCSVVCTIRLATWYPIVSHNSYHSNYRCVWCGAVEDIIPIT